MRPGLSLSLCVAEILNGRVRVEDVREIRTNTRAITEEDWERLLDGYCRTYWRQDPERARRVVTALRESQRITQPRVDDPDYGHTINDGIWERD